MAQHNIFHYVVKTIQRPKKERGVYSSWLASHVGTPAANPILCWLRRLWSLDCTVNCVNAELCYLQTLDSARTRKFRGYSGGWREKKNKLAIKRHGKLPKKGEVVSLFLLQWNNNEGVLFAVHVTPACAFSWVYRAGPGEKDSVL